MAILGVTSQDGRLFCRTDPGADPRFHLAKALSRVPERAPIVIMLHGYRYNPRFGVRDPHRLLYSDEPTARSRKVVSWPRSLGFSKIGPEDGLAIGFGWEGWRPSRFQTSLFPARFSPAYHQAGHTAEHLTVLLEWLSELAPYRKIDIFAHSLGARVALQAVSRHMLPNIGRVILLGAAEFGSVAHDALKNTSRFSTTEFINIVCRENWLYDLLFETLAPETKDMGTSIGRGISTSYPHWLDLSLDAPDALNILSGRGVGLELKSSWADHWGFYTRAGIFLLYRQLLRNRELWALKDLHKELLSAEAPRVHPALRPSMSAPLEIPHFAG